MDRIQSVSSALRSDFASIGTSVLQTHVRSIAGGGVALRVRLAALLSLVALAALFTPIVWGATEEESEEIPARPAEFTVTVTPGVVVVNLHWSAVAGADEYWLRWRSVDKGERLSAGIRPAGTAVSMKMPAYGSWVVRVQACNAAGCSQPNSKRFTVEAPPEPTPEPKPEPQRQAEPDPIPGQPAGLTVSAERGALNVALDWDDVDGATRYRLRWRAVESGAKLNDGIEPDSSEVAISVADYGDWVVRLEACNDSGCGPHLASRFTVEPPNRAPQVDTGSARYSSFVSSGPASRGVIVTKAFDGIFSDPDGDQLSYHLSAVDGPIELVEQLGIFPDGVSDAAAAGSERTLSALRVYFQADSDDDWKFANPTVPDPLVITVTLTATDSHGLSASVQGEFSTDWASHPHLQSAVANPTAIVLTYDLPLRAIPAPSPQQFTVNVANTDGSAGTVEVSSVSLSDATVTLALGSALKPGQTVSLDYAANAQAPLQRAAGGDPAPSFNGRAIDVPLPALRVAVCGRTPKVRDALARAAGKDCADITAADLAEIDSHDFFWDLEHVTSLKSGDFEGLYNLKVLRLHDHRLTALPEDVFEDLHSLEELEISIWVWGSYGVGGLTALPENVFDSLSNLKELDLDGNGLRTLPEDVFDGLDSLESLNLGYTALATLPEDVFEGLENLQTLDLYVTALTALPEDLFDGLSSLQTLDLQRNNLTALPEDVFDGLTSLEKLDLRANSLSGLPADVFDGMSSLQSLILTNNDLTALPENVLDGLSSLQVLALESNDLTVLPEDLFDGLSSLQELFLFSNHLTALPEDVFDGLSNLQILRLDDNGLRSALPESLFDGLSSLQRLNLERVFDIPYVSAKRRFQGLDLSAVPERFFDYYPEDFFDGVDPAVLPENLFDGLSNLQELSLSANLLELLPEDLLGGLSSLQTLELRSNRLSDLPDDVFDGLSSLQTLTLHRNDLTELPVDVFDGLSGLQSLDLSLNDLTEFPEGMFDDISNLETLNLRYNKLSQLPVGIFAGLSKLESLDLSENPGTPFDLTALGIRSGVTVTQ